MLRIALTLVLTVSLATSTSGVSLAYSSIQPLQTPEGRNICTVFSINEQARLWMTAAHCVITELSLEHGGTRVTMPFIVAPYMFGVQTEVVQAVRPLDIAVLRAVRGAPALRMAKHAPKVGDELKVKGFGYGWRTPTTFWGRLANPSADVDENETTPPYAVYDMHIMPGHSGSPILTPDHRIVGVGQIVFGGLGMSGGSPYDVTRQWVERYAK